MWLHYCKYWAQNTLEVSLDGAGMSSEVSDHLTGVL